MTDNSKIGRTIVKTIDFIWVQVGKWLLLINKRSVWTNIKLLDFTILSLKSYAY